MIRSRSRPGPREHGWHDGVCRFCGLRQEETWVLDERGRPVMALAWSPPGGRVVRVRPFAYFTGLEPPADPLARVAERFPSASIGGAPPCPGVLPE